MRLLIALLLPCLLFFTIGRPLAGVTCLILQITLIGWAPAAIWAVYALNHARQTRKSKISPGVRTNHPVPAPHLPCPLSAAPAMSQFTSSYDPTSFEARLYAEWEAAGHFKPSGVGQPYTILLPPPNVTGTLHMGHAFQQTLMDALVRYHRMCGDDTLWQVGTDHAGIATEMVVSRNMALEGRGETRDSLGREGFINKVWEWKQQSGDTIERQMRRLGVSADWSRSTFTMDAQPSAAVTEAFVRWYEEGLIYRGQRLVNWDPVLKTAISGSGSGERPRRRHALVDPLSTERRRHLRTH